MTARIVTRPEICYGQPHIEGTRITCWAIDDRIEAGETIESVAADLDVPPEAVERAMEFLHAFKGLIREERRALARSVREVCLLFEDGDL